MGLSAYGRFLQSVRSTKGKTTLYLAIPAEIEVSGFLNYIGIEAIARQDEDCDIDLKIKFLLRYLVFDFDFPDS